MPTATPAHDETREAHATHICVDVNELTRSVSLVCPPGHHIEEILFASFGTPTGDCNSSSSSSSTSYRNDNCHAKTSLAVVRNRCIDEVSCDLIARTDQFGPDPCEDVPKRLLVQAVCSDKPTDADGKHTVTQDTSRNRTRSNYIMYWPFVLFLISDHKAGYTITQSLLFSLIAGVRGCNETLRISGNNYLPKEVEKFNIISMASTDDSFELWKFLESEKPKPLKPYRLLFINRDFYQTAISGYLYHSLAVPDKREHFLTWHFSPCDIGDALDNWTLYYDLMMEYVTKHQQEDIREYETELQKSFASFGKACDRLFANYSHNENYNLMLRNAKKTKVPEKNQSTSPYYNDGLLLDVMRTFASKQYSSLRNMAINKLKVINNHIDGSQIISTKFSSFADITSNATETTRRYNDSISFMYDQINLCFDLSKARSFFMEEAIIQPKNQEQRKHITSNIVASHERTLMKDFLRWHPIVGIHFRVFETFP